MSPTAAKIDPNVVVLDFTDLRPRSGGPRAHVPEGDYLLELTAAEHVAIKSGVNKGKPQISWQFKIVAPGAQVAMFAEARKGVGDSIYLNTATYKDSKGLFFLRNLVDDLMADKLNGGSTTGAVTTFSLPDKIGRQIGATLVDGDPYGDEDKVSSEIKFTYPASKFRGAAGTEESDEEEQDAPAPAPKAAAPKPKANGAATAQTAAAAAEAASTADEDEDIEELPVQSL